MMPMIFAEHERSRFLQIMEVKGSRMQEMILNLQNMAIDGRDGVRRGNVTTRRDYEAGYLWDDLSRLKIGMESLKKMLGVLDRQFDTFGELELRPGIEGKHERIVDSTSSKHMQSRLLEMEAELDTNIRTCESLIAGLDAASRTVCPDLALIISYPLTQRRRKTIKQDEMNN